jgi:hypothetical protein
MLQNGEQRISVSITQQVPVQGMVPGRKGVADAAESVGFLGEPLSKSDQIFSASYPGVLRRRLQTASCTGKDS